jgi:hypothetical protein
VIDNRFHGSLDATVLDPNETLMTITRQIIRESARFHSGTLNYCATEIVNKIRITEKGLILGFKVILR